MKPKNRIEATPPGQGGTPVSTELRAGGMRRHTMADGELLEEDGPSFRMEYQSTIPGETYTRDIAIFGLDEREHLFKAWCYTYNALRTYAFSKVVCLEEIATGQRVTGEELRVHMGGAKPPE